MDNTAVLREFLTTGFSHADLREFCFDTDQFRDIYYDLPASSAKSEWVNRILEKGGEHRTLLLDWAKRKNPNKYHLFFK